MSGRPNVWPPEDAVPFEPDEFAVVYDFVARASMSMRAGRAAGLNVRGADDSAAAWKARGATLAGAFAPVREWYEGAPEKYHSAVHRMTALAKLIKGSFIKEWITVTKEGVAVHRAVLAAAATMPLTREGEFVAVDFVDEVKRRAGGTSL